MASCQLKNDGSSSRLLTMRLAVNYGYCREVCVIADTYIGTQYFVLIYFGGISSYYMMPRVEDFLVRYRETRITSFIDSKIGVT